MCGHQDPDIHPTLVLGEMDFTLLETIRSQLEPGVAIHFHRDGEPTDYPRLRDALSLFTGFLTTITTHGERLAERADDIINFCTTVCVSVFRGDPDHDLQMASVKEFLKRKGSQPPMVQIKIVGDYPDSPWEKLDVPIIRRLLHVPDGNYRYIKRAPTIPETRVCEDFLHRPSVDWRGRVFICNRLDDSSSGLLGSLRESSLDDLWNSPQRRDWMAAHLKGRRDQAAPLCKDCKFWGIASSAA
jgi:radical SAM protein with 4Fe4S-binding SPASM domain